MPKTNEATDTDLKVIERLVQIGWPKACIEKRGDTLFHQHNEL